MAGLLHDSRIKEGLALGRGACDDHKRSSGHGGRDVVSRWIDYLFLDGQFRAASHPFDGWNTAIAHDARRLEGRARARLAADASGWKEHPDDRPGGQGFPGPPQ